MLLAASTLAASQGLPPVQRDLASRFGLTPAQAREVYQRLDANDSLLGHLAQENGVQRLVLRAIALELGARNPGLEYQAYVRVIRARAADAAAAQKALASLTKAVAALDPGGARKAALDIVKKAHDAFDAGHLKESENEFARLSFLRRRDLSGAYKAWLAATDLQAKSAALRGDVDAADRIYSEKAAEIGRQRRESEREQWSTELARADMWYASGRALGKNEDLQKAILIYRESVQPLAPRERTPVDWATTQVSLGRALQVLGSRANTTALLEEAAAANRSALQELTSEGQTAVWGTAQNNLGAVLSEIGERDTGTARLQEAEQVLSSALEGVHREQFPNLWSDLKHNQALVLQLIGERKTGSVELEKAIQNYRDALQERPRELEPLSWAQTQNNIGAALVSLGIRQDSTSRFEEAVTAYQAALQALSRERTPLEWARTKANLGNALWRLGQRESGNTHIEESIQAYREALQEFTRERVPLEWARAQNNLGNALSILGERTGNDLRLEDAVQAFQAALRERTRELWPGAWATTQNDLGATLAVLGKRKVGNGQLELAVQAFRSALLERTRDREPFFWAETQSNLGDTLLAIGEREKSAEWLQESILAYQLSLSIFTVEAFPRQFEAVKKRLAQACSRLDALGVK